MRLNLCKEAPIYGSLIYFFFLGIPCEAFTSPLSNKLLSKTKCQAVSDDRRSFLINSSAVAIATNTFFINASPSLALDIKVTPLAHTFITASGAPKPLRENDATRYLTNAKVTYLFTGDSSDNHATLSNDVLKLTNTRKIEQGPGVTPGCIHVATMSKSTIDLATSLNLKTTKVSDFSATSIAKIASSLPDGDTLVVGPILSAGVAKNGEILADCSKALNGFVGGSKSGGVLSALLDGPKTNLDMIAQGYPISTILWYNAQSGKS